MKRPLRTVLVLAMLVLLAVSGCSLIGGDEVAQETAQAEVIPTAAATPTAANTPESTPESTPPPRLSLRVWTVAGMSPDEDGPAATLLADQLSAFDASHPDLDLLVETKASSGQGGILAYLRAGRGVAPGILPDVIVLPTDQLSAAVAENLIMPLDDLLGQDTVADLYPAARQLGQLGDGLYGYPVTLSNLQHAAFVSGNVFSNTVPVRFDDLLETNGAAYAFAAGGSPGAELALQLYLAEGGALPSPGGTATLDLDTLAKALGYFERGRAAGVILIQSGNLSTVSDAWSLLENGAANMVQTNASIYLGQQPTPINISFTRHPGPQGGVPALVRGQALAISTSDPVRQALASELLEWLAAPQNLGAWSAAAGRLPARQAAFEQWPISAYTAFLGNELARALPYPQNLTSTLLSALGSAVFDVVSSGVPARTAAEALVAESQSP